MRPSIAHAIAVLAALCGAFLPPLASAQIVQRNAEYWLPADHNYAFYERHEAAARSFYPAHYAHFVVYEQGLEGQRGLDARLLAAESEIRALIANPPVYEPPIDLVAPNWTRIAHRTAAAMDWTHHLHEQLYDVLSDPRVRDRKAAGERAISHYLDRTGAAFSTRGYGHRFMLGAGEWSGTFARRFPSVNGILWAYHWHHAAVYEALMETDPVAQERQMARVLRVFVDSVLANPPEYMPLTAEVAPRFSAMFPAAAHVFDNLHMMHDVVNDIMTAAEVPESAKAVEVERVLQQMLFDSQEWVVPPDVSHEKMMEAMPGMPMGAMRVPTQLPDGRWLPQGHPDAAMPESMEHGGGHGAGPPHVDPPRSDPGGDGGEGGAP